MASHEGVLPAVALPGLRLEVLGNYLASLGILRVLARQWPGVRIGWYEGIPRVVGGPQNVDELVAALDSVAANSQWTAYERAWLKAQSEATTKKSARPLALWQSSAPELLLEMFLAHEVPLNRVAFNPLLGSGGNAGRREFAKGWKLAVDRLKRPPKGVCRRAELRNWLCGMPTQWLLRGIVAASWFSNANKLYNSGQSPFREEPLSPWAMALACEGLPFFAGGSSRRLGARTRAQAAFPFVCRPAAPAIAGEAGRDRGEVWAPIWERPMTLPEVRALFQRGRAETRGRGATTPAAFAAAIVRRGVDAGVLGFARFVLGATTSANTFEPRYQGLTVVPRRSGDPRLHRTRAQVAERILGLVERLPADRKEGNRWRFHGLRGPVEAALIRAAQAADDPEALCAVLDAVVQALDRVDRNASYRKAGVRWRPLPVEAVPLLFPNSAPPLEARLALAFVSAFPRALPFALYRFGVLGAPGRFEHPEQPPARWVYGPGLLARTLADVLLRLILDWQESKAGNSGQLWRPRHWPAAAARDDVDAWLRGDLDEELLARWLARFALFDWQRIPDEVRKLPQTTNASAAAADGSLLFLALLQPLFDGRPLWRFVAGGRVEVPLDRTGARTAGAARAIAARIRTGQIAAAVELARSRYALADVALLRLSAEFRLVDPERLLAGLLFPLNDRDRSALFERWVRLEREKGGHVRV
ncbi:MAG: type I-U CRISPR-associated protein Csx17 [Candidatus Binatia bacterium]|nr:type I-U CRISPR-associated protein Csx17 [Candidatus Binatia bacterium]